MSHKSISDFLIENSISDNISFHMPGHKGRAGIFESSGYGRFISNIISKDITEIDGADTLYSPKSTIRAVMENYAKLYEAKHCELLVNGASAGVVSAILATVPRRGKLILGRNSHHSAFSALRLGDIEPAYVGNEFNGEFNLQGGISPRKVALICEMNPDASAVLITSPNYYGVLSDIDKIADVVHRYGMVLIVDQAHGAHLKFADYLTKIKKSKGEYISSRKSAAENQRADIVICSTHKTLLSFTGSGILNIFSERVNIEKLANILRMVQTTSPSYLMLGSLDVNEKIIREYGKKLIESWYENLDTFYRCAKKIDGLNIVDIDRLDRVKINVSMKRLGLSGQQLKEELQYRKIIPEMVHGDFVLLMSGIGNMGSDYEHLLKALREISETYGYGVSASKYNEDENIHYTSHMNFDLESVGIPENTEKIPLYRSEGRVSAESIISYPPGSPIVCPGEIMNMDVINYISEAIARGDIINGVDEEGYICVGEEQF